MRVFELPPGVSHREAGRAHGEAFRGMIAELAEIRMGLTLDLGRFASIEHITNVAAAHLPVLARWDHALHDELVGIAEGANVSAEDVLVLNHYTDLRDIVVDENDTDGCSAVFARTPSGALLGQTWDMHGSAEPYVMMLGVPAKDETPSAWLLSITGCLGMAGLNAAGLGLTINNLKSTDGRVGVTWPALVRRVLRERRLEDAEDAILSAPIGSGRHYMAASTEGVFGIEVSGERKQFVLEGNPDAFVHTNHCLDVSIAERTTVSPESTTYLRYEALTASVSARAVTDREDLFRRLGSHEGYPRGVCTHLSSPSRPHAMKTCGAIVMDLARREVLAAAGCVYRARPQIFGLVSEGGGRA